MQPAAAIADIADTDRGHGSLLVGPQTGLKPASIAVSPDFKGIGAKEATFPWFCAVLRREAGFCGKSDVARNFVRRGRETGKPRVYAGFRLVSAGFRVSLLPLLHNGGSAIPAQGVTISFPLYNWFAAAQTPVNKVSILLGNLTANAASGMRLAYCLGPHDYFKNNFAGDSQIDNYGFGDVVNADPTLGWVILPANACDIAAGAQETLRDTDWNTYTANESFLWVDLPFGQYLSEFTVYVRVFIPQFTTGQQYASAYRSSSQGTSFLVHQQALGSEAINDQFGIATRYRQKPGNYVASIQESSIAWATTPDGWGAYDPPNVPTIPVLAIRWGT